MNWFDVVAKTNLNQFKLPFRAFLAALAFLVLFAAFFLFLSLKHRQPKRQVAEWISGRTAFFLEQLFLLAHLFLIKNLGKCRASSWINCHSSAIYLEFILIVVLFLWKSAVSAETLLQSKSPAYLCGMTKLLIFEPLSTV